MSGNVSQSPGGSTPPQKPATFGDIIRSIEARLLSYGQGPHTDKQKEDIKNLNLLLSKTREQAKKAEPTFPATAVSAAAPSMAPTAAATSSGSSMATPGHQMLTPSALAAIASAQTSGEPRVLEKKRLQELVREVDPMEQLEDDVEEALIQIADDFIDNVINSACELAKHRKSDILEVKDVQLHLDRAWNMWLPGFGSDDLRPYKKAPTTEAHKQRLALIKKTMKKY